MRPVDNVNGNVTARSSTKARTTEKPTTTTTAPPLHTDQDTRFERTSSTTPTSGTPSPITTTTNASTTPAKLQVSTTRTEAAHAARSKAIASEALAAAQGKTGDDAIKRACAVILAAPELAGALVSLTVARRDGSAIVESNPLRAQNPCSNAKLATAAYALSVLGPTHRFKTEALLDGEGTLSLRGHFDPTLKGEDLAHIAQGIAAAGIKNVKRFVLDNSALVGGNVPNGFSGYGDQDWEYLARPEALSVDKNAIHLVIHPNSTSGETGVIESNQSAFVIRNRVTTVDGGTPFKVGCDEKDTAGVLERDASGKAIIDVWGTIAADYTKGKTLVMKSPSPTESFADAFRRALESAGVSVGNDGDVGVAKPDAKPVFTHRSKPLSEILKTSLATSNAFDHEMFALAAAEKESGGSVSLPDASKRLDAFLVRTVDAKDALMANASGIGNESLLSSSDVVKILLHVNENPRLAAMGEALARPGAKGTLGARMLDTPAETRLTAKTGTGDVAVALSGFIGDDVPELAFSFLVDEHQSRDGARAALDAMGIVLSTLRP